MRNKINKVIIKSKIEYYKNKLDGGITMWNTLKTLAGSKQIKTPKKLIHNGEVIAFLVKGIFRSWQSPL